MTSEIIGIPSTDHSQEIIDKITTELSHKGVLLFDQDETLEGVTLTYRGQGNKRKASYALTFQSIKDLSPEQIQEKASEIMKEVEAKMLAGGDE